MSSAALLNVVWLIMSHSQLAPGNAGQAWSDAEEYLGQNTAKLVVKKNGALVTMVGNGYDRYAMIYWLLTKATT